MNQYGLHALLNYEHTNICAKMNYINDSYK